MDPLTVGAIVGGGSLISAAGSWLGGNSQADAMREANRRNEALTRESWARDDTAVSRRVADLVKSGLNPALAAGSAAGNSAPLAQQPEGNSGPAEALKGAGASIAAYPTVEATIRRSNAATLASEAQASLTSSQADIAAHDYKEIKAGRDPRDKTMINSILKAIPNIVKTMSPGGAAREAGQHVANWIDEKSTKMAAPEVARQKALGLEVDDINRRMRRAMNAGDIEGAKRYRRMLDQY